VIGKAVLPGYALCFPRYSQIRNCGVAGIAETPGAEVWGVVYRLHDGDLAALDRREGYDPAKPAHVNRYNRTTVRVLRDGEALDCVTYLARKEPGEHVPSVDYMSALIAGAAENGLPEEYICRLRTIATL
jgi:gamma-glutamylcyclotransferase (GGCT)/AIG2-like uncharacterized protein YtfP